MSSGEKHAIRVRASASARMRPAAWQARDAGTWLLLVGAGLALAAAALALRARVGSSAAPFTGTYRLKLELGSLLAPAVATAVLVAVRRGLLSRVAWRRLLGLSYLAALAWSLALALVDGGNGLASPVVNTDEYFRDVSAVGSSLGHFLRTFVAAAPHLSVATRTHPPGPVLLLWGLRHVGVVRPELLGLVLTALGCLTVPLVGIAVRSLCHEPAARRLLPVLALAPYAVWVAVSMDAVTMALCAGFITCGVLASEHGRRGREQTGWALGAGLLLGVAALFGYAVAWLAASVIATYFVRRRPLLNLVTAIGALVPLFVVRAAGFIWPDGLTSAQVDFANRVGPHRSWLLWAFLDLAVLVMACGPCVVTAARRVRLTPGWPFLVGAVLAVAFAVGSGLSRGEVERSWLPFFPWLLVPAVAPPQRAAESLPEPAEEGGPDDEAGPIPWALVALGAGAAVVLESVVRTTW